MANRACKLFFATNDIIIGYHSRKATLGPEGNLVSHFLNEGLVGQGYSFVADNLAVFVEPKLDTGFPDLVLAEFKQDVFMKWRDVRMSLTALHLRILSFLYTNKYAGFNDIREKMHLSLSTVACAIEQLCDSGLIDRDRDLHGWRPLPLSKTYGIKRLIAIEAKICNNANVLAQASLNRWFASESYALTPMLPAPSFKERARHVGIGVVAETSEMVFKKCVGARRCSLPSSYASWLFNEWIGRKLLLGVAA